MEIFPILNMFLPERALITEILLKGHKITSHPPSLLPLERFTKCEMYKLKPACHRHSLVMACKICVFEPLKFDCISFKANGYKFFFLTVDLIFGGLCCPEK